jgi:HEPN domain-containing protein
MTDESNPLAWIEIAEEDYLVARSVMRRKRPLTHSACFHAQQCAEKYVKALLTARGREFPKTHDLLTLDTMCAEEGIFLGLTPSQLGILSSHAVRVRYPGDAPTIEEAWEAIEIAKAVRRFARKFLS